jgi:protein-tyrosine phosphatase
MAEAIARALLDPDDRAQVLSAGVAAERGHPAAPEAVAALERMGLDLSGHRSRPVDRDLIARATVIYTMTDAHRGDILAIEPSASSKTFTLDPLGPVPDPIGMPIEQYLQTAAVLRDLVAGRLEEFAS